MEPPGRTLKWPSSSKLSSNHETGFLFMAETTRSSVCASNAEIAKARILWLSKHDICQMFVSRDPLRIRNIKPVKECGSCRMALSQPAVFERLQMVIIAAQ